MTSSDGFCSTLTFSPGELGQIYTGEIQKASVSSSQTTPMQTPTSTIAPPSPFPSHHRTSSYPIAPSPPPAPLGTSMHPSSPTRSNSTSSVATQSSYATPAPGTIISNPSLVSGSVPSIGAGNASFVGSFNHGGIPMSTPPQTPRSTASSVSGIKREASESETDLPDKKKRRIAPTPVGAPKS